MSSIKNLHSLMFRLNCKAFYFNTIPSQLNRNNVNLFILRSFALILFSFSCLPAFTQLKIEPQNLLLSSGETAIFKATSNNENLQYQWLKNDRPIEGETASTLTYENVKLAEDNTLFQLVAKDGINIIKSEAAQLRVTSNNRPYPVINLISNGYGYVVGDTIFFEGRVTDLEEGVLEANSFTWAVELYQNDQLYSVTTPTSGIMKGYFTIPIDKKISEDAWYRITLIGTDSEGLSQRTFYDVFPEKTQFELMTLPNGLNLKIDQNLHSAPHLVHSIKGMKWNIAAPKLQYRNGKSFMFVKWSDGFPEADYPLYADENFLLQAIYREVTLDNGTGLLGRYFESEEQQKSNSPTLTRVDEIFFLEEDTSDSYIVKEWIGEITTLVSDWHEFEIESDGNIRLYIDGQLLIDRWDSKVKLEKTAKIQLERGKRYPVHLEVKNAKTLGLFWSTPDLIRSLVPKNQLFPASDQGNSINLKHYYDRQKGVFNLQLSKFDAEQEQINIRILDTQGRTFFQDKFNMGKGLKTINLDMRFFIPGIYFLEIRGKSFKKVIKVPKR